MTLNILDKQVTDHYDQNLQKHVDGFKLEVYDIKEGGKRLYTGIVWPNDIYEYETEAGGEFEICVGLTDSMFVAGSQIKTQVKFASDFHRDKRAAKEGEEFHVKEA